MPGATFQTGSARRLLEDLCSNEMRTPSPTGGGGPISGGTYQWVPKFWLSMLIRNEASVLGRVQVVESQARFVQCQSEVLRCACSHNCQQAERALSVIREDRDAVAKRVLHP